jgi:hypothetical protein
MQLSSSALNSSSIILTIGLFAVFIVLREVLLRQSSARPLIYYLLLFPGIIIHELSHMTMCLVTFTKVKSVKLFSKTGGFVVHQTPRFIVISFLISVAPILTGSIAIFLTLRYLHASNYIDMINITSAFLLYFLSSILITMLPSKQDLLNAFSVYLALFIALVCYYFLSESKINLYWVNLALILCLAILAIINLIIFSINKLWKLK